VETNNPHCTCPSCGGEISSTVHDGLKILYCTECYLFFTKDTETGKLEVIEHSPFGRAVHDRSQHPP
jgi:Zn-finger nucleic acid-binding protein